MSEHTPTIEYTPTTDEVREDFAYPWEGFKQNREGRLAAFDRWHAAEIAAAEQRGAVKALRQAADGLENTTVNWSNNGEDSRAAWLRRRADEIERTTDE